MENPTSQPGAAEQAREFSSWLWPDRVIGKRESRQLREEHNRLVNAHAALVEIAAERAAPGTPEQARIVLWVYSQNEVCDGKATGRTVWRAVSTGQNEAWASVLGRGDSAAEAVQDWNVRAQLDGHNVFGFGSQEELEEEAASSPETDGKRDLATILAALRVYQCQLDRNGGRPPASVHEIATDCGTLVPLGPGEINDLCERLNFADGLIQALRAGTSR